VARQRERRGQKAEGCETTLFLAVWSGPGTYSLAYLTLAHMMQCQLRANEHYQDTTMTNFSNVVSAAIWRVPDSANEDRSPYPMVLAQEPLPLSNKDSPPNSFAFATRNISTTTSTSRVVMLRLDCLSAYVILGSLISATTLYCLSYSRHLVPRSSMKLVRMLIKVRRLLCAFDVDLVASMVLPDSARLSQQLSISLG
jgi:hypothetical protein